MMELWSVMKDMWGGGGGRDQILDPPPPPPKYQILRAHTNQISGLIISDIRSKKKSIIRYQTP